MEKLYARVQCSPEGTNRLIKTIKSNGYSVKKESDDSGKYLKCKKGDETKKIYLQNFKN